MVFGANNVAEGLSCALEDVLQHLPPTCQWNPPHPGMTPKLSPDIAKCPLQVKLPPFENTVLQEIDPPPQSSW